MPPRYVIVVPDRVLTEFSPILTHFQRFNVVNPDLLKKSGIYR
jgi:hypothetical protein